MIILGAAKLPDIAKFFDQDVKESKQEVAMVVPANTAAAESERTFESDVNRVAVTAKTSVSEATETVQVEEFRIGVAWRDVIFVPAGASCSPRSRWLTYRRDIGWPGIRLVRSLLGDP